MTNTKKIVRQQLANIVDLEISPARIRRFMDHELVNKRQSERQYAVGQQLQVIKKEGCPIQLPVAPKPAGRDAKEAAKTKYLQDRKDYVAQLKQYNDYESPRFLKLQLLHKYCKALAKLHTLREKSEHSEKQREDIKVLLAQLNDKLAPQRSGESSEDYKARAEKFTPAGLSALHHAHAKFDTPADIEAELARVKQEYPDLNLFMTKDDISKDRTRFNDKATVSLAAFVQAALEQFIEFSINKTIDSAKKIVQPDHCVDPALSEKCSLFPLIANLPHFLAVKHRQDRHDQWLDERHAAKVKLIQNAKLKANRTKTPYKNPKFSFHTFPESEVAGGYAKVEQIITDESTRKSYYWYNIDIPADGAEETTIDFQFYIKKVYKKVVDIKVMSGDSHAGDIRISSSFKKFLSDMIIDFIMRITPMAIQLMEVCGVKTISETLIMAIVKMLLIDSYEKKSEVVELSDEHKELFDSVEKRVELCREHHTMKDLEAADEVAEETGDETEDDIEEVPEQSAPQTNGHKVETKTQQSTPAALTASTPKTLHKTNNVREKMRGAVKVDA